MERDSLRENKEYISGRYVSGEVILERDFLVLVFFSLF